MISSRSVTDRSRHFSAVIVGPLHVIILKRSVSNKKALSFDDTRQDCALRSCYFVGNFASHNVDVSATKSCLSDVEKNSQRNTVRQNRMCDVGLTGGNGTANCMFCCCCLFLTISPIIYLTDLYQISRVVGTIGNKSVPKILINNTTNLFFKLQSPFCWLLAVK